MSLKLHINKIAQSTLENYMTSDFRDLFELCPFPILGTLGQQGKDIKKLKFGMDFNFTNRLHNIGISIEKIPYFSDLKEQSIKVYKDDLISILNSIPNDNNEITLTIKDECPLVITLEKEAINVVLSPIIDEDDEE